MYEVEIQRRMRLLQGVTVKYVASVAQLVEQLTLNQLVWGSSPHRGTNPLLSLQGLEAVKSDLFAFAPAIKGGGVNPHLCRHPRQIIAAGFQQLFCHSEFLFSVKRDWTRITRN